MSGNSTDLLNIIFEDNHLIAVSKTAGMIVQGDKTGDEPLSETVALYLKEKYQKPGEAFIGVIHRLDRPVSGLVLFARTSKALSRMNEQFRERNIRKIYHALVEGTSVPEEGILVHYLDKNEHLNKSRASLTERKGALRCELQFRLLRRLERYALLEVEPLTGRHHQIRVQLAASGWPIKGDVKYGARRGNPDRSICLHAFQLSFEHPVKKEPILITAPVPVNTAWNALKD